MRAPVVPMAWTAICPSRKIMIQNIQFLYTQQLKKLTKWWHILIAIFLTFQPQAYDSLPSTALGGGLIWLYSYLLSRSLKISQSMYLTTEKWLETLPILMISSKVFLDSMLNLQSLIQTGAAKIPIHQHLRLLIRFSTSEIQIQFNWLPISRRLKKQLGNPLSKIWWRCKQAMSKQPMQIPKGSRIILDSSLRLVLRME